MDVTVSAKIQLIPSDEDAESLVDTSHIYTKACNYVSDYIVARRIDAGANSELIPA